MFELIVKAVLFIIALVVSGYVIPILKNRNIYDYVVIAVQAAEQMYKESGKGKEKFEYVKKWVKSKFNIELKDEDLKTIIESAVYELNNNKAGGK